MAIMKRIAIIAALLAGNAGATPYDGLYHPSFGGWSCEREQVGVVGGGGGKFNGLLLGRHQYHDISSIDENSVFQVSQSCSCFIS